MNVLRAYASWAVLLGLLALIGAYVLVGAKAFDETIRVLILPVSLMTIVGYGSTALSCFVTPGWPNRKQWLALTVNIFAFSTAIGGLNSLFYRLSGKPGWITDLPTTNAWPMGTLVLGIALLLAPGFFDADVRPQSRRWVAGLCLAAVLLPGALWAADPDLRPWADWIETHWIGKPAPRRECPPV